LFNELKRFITVPFEDKEQDLEQVMVYFMNCYCDKFREYMEKAIKFNTLTESQEEDKMQLG
jgi:hypothetical protein